MKQEQIKQERKVHEKVEAMKTLKKSDKNKKQVQNTGQEELALDIKSTRNITDGKTGT